MRRITLLVMLAAALTVGPGCVEYRVVESGWDDWPQDPKPADSETAQDGDGWTVIVHQFTGPERREHANDMLHRLKRDTSLTDLWVHEARGAAAVYRGRYTERRAAETALQQVRQTTLAGRKPFRHADLVPLQRRNQTFDDPLNAAQFPGRFTLQIGYFDEDFDGDRRKAAEETVHALRDAGHDAYYYHGEHNSLVTIGVYDYREAFVSRPDPRLPSSLIDMYAPYIHELQEQFPYNLGNTPNLLDGQEQDHPDAQPSMLTRIH